MDRDTAFEFAKQSLMNDNVAQCLRRNNIKIQYANPSESYHNTVKEYLDTASIETIELDHRLIPGLQNLKTDSLLKKILRYDSMDAVEMIKKMDLEEHRYRDYDLTKFCRSIQEKMIDPPLLLCQSGRLSVIDGRTRLLVAYNLKTSIIVNLIVDID